VSSTLTLVDWAIIVSMAASAITLVIVGADFYQSHLKTKRSDVSARPSNSRDANASLRRKSTIWSPVTLANEGERSGVVRARQCDIQVQPSERKFSWRELQNMSENSSPYVYLDQLDNFSVAANSTNEARVKFGTRGIEQLESILDDADQIEISVVVDVEDNIGHYHIGYSDTIQTP